MQRKKETSNQSIDLKQTSDENLLQSIHMRRYSNYRTDCDMVFESECVPFTHGGEEGEDVIGAVRGENDWENYAGEKGW